jgi:hypothetical protein
MSRNTVYVLMYHSHYLLGLIYYGTDFDETEYRRYNDQEIKFWFDSFQFNMNYQRCSTRI